MTWERFEIDFTNYQESNGMSYVSKIDHFFWSESLSESIIDAGVLHLVDNLSDHSPIFCIIETESIDVDLTNSINSSLPPKPSWKKATSEQKLQYPKTQ